MIPQGCRRQSPSIEQRSYGASLFASIDRVALARLASQLERAVTAAGLDGIVLIPVVAIATALARLILNDDQVVLVFGLTLVPLASSIGVEPWTVGIAILAMTPFWFVPAQSPVYGIAQATAEERLFSHRQARRAALVYAAVVVTALVLVLPYWRAVAVL